MAFVDEHPFVDHVPGRLRLRGTICLVIGAGVNELGMIARLFAIEGARILAVQENESELRTLVNTIEEEGGSATYKVLPGCAQMNAETIVEKYFVGRAFGLVLSEISRIDDDQEEGDPTARTVRLQIATARLVKGLKHKGSLETGASVYHPANTITFKVASHAEESEHWALTRQIAYAALFLGSDEANIGNDTFLSVTVHSSKAFARLGGVI